MHRVSRSRSTGPSCDNQFTSSNGTHRSSLTKRAPSLHRRRTRLLNRSFDSLSQDKTNLIVSQNSNSLTKSQGAARLLLDDGVGAAEVSPLSMHRSSLLRARSIPRKLRRSVEAYHLLRLVLRMQNVQQSSKLSWIV